MALVEEAAIPAALRFGQVPLIVTPLTEPPEGASQRQYLQWDRTCDCCGKHCAYPKHNFYTGQVQRTSKAGVLVIISFGICEEHRFDG